MITILATIFLLGVMILVHELGHFWMARRVGIKVLKFSFGFPPKLFGFTRGGTEYLVQAIPVGGYVKLAGEEAFDDGYVPQPGDYMACPWWGRSLMALAGPMANLVTALVIFVFIGLTGVRESDYPPMIGTVEAGSTFEKAGLVPGDKIVSIGGYPVDSWHGAYLAWGRAAHGTSNRIAVVLERGNRVDTVQVVQSNRDEEWYRAMTALAPSKLGDITPGYPAYQAGLMKGDLVLSVDERPVRTWYEMKALIVTKADKDVRLTILRNTDTLRIMLRPVAQPNGEAVIGISAPEYGSYKLRLGLLQALSTAVLSTGSLVIRTYQVLITLVARPSSAKQLGSILMIGQMAGETAKKGFSDLMLLMALLSVSLMVMNLLPLPVLDGGVIFFSVLEGIRKKPLPVKAQSVIQQIGVVLLVAVMLLAVANDGLRMMTRRAALKSNAPAAGQKK